MVKEAATAAHTPNRLGEIYDRALVEKDRKYLDTPLKKKAP